MMNVNDRASAYTTQMISTMINSGWFNAGDRIVDQQTAAANVANVTTAYNTLFDAVLTRLVVRRQDGGTAGRRHSPAHPQRRDL
jgi:hypothetical protein